MSVSNKEEHSCTGTEQEPDMTVDESDLDTTLEVDEALSASDSGQRSDTQIQMKHPKKFSRVRSRHPEAFREKEFSADELYEYRWPSDRNGQFFMLQEQVCEYLEVKSFKRKYPELSRRSLENDERDFLLRESVINLSQCNLGLLALRSEEVLDLMAADYPDKFTAYQKVIANRKREELLKAQKDYSSCATNDTSIDEKRTQDLRKRALKAANEWNTKFMNLKKDERKGFLDVQTMTIQMPTPTNVPKINVNFGAYPVALLPGQYQNFYKDYSPEEVRKRPLTTVLDYSSYLPKRTCTDIVNDVLSELSREPKQDVPLNATPSNTNQVGRLQSDILTPTLASFDGVSCTSCKQDVCIVETFAKCSKCARCTHVSCLEISIDMFDIIKTYDWQCMDCKPCSVCNKLDHEDKIIFCDRCDRGYHTYCVDLDQPPKGRWVCARFCSFKGIELPLLVRHSPKDTLICVNCGRGIRANRSHKIMRRIGQLCTMCAKESLPRASSPHKLLTPVCSPFNNSADSTDSSSMTTPFESNSFQ